MKETKSWKLFGKLNIIDLLIILIVIAALVFGAVRFLGNRNGSDAGAAPQNLKVTFYGFDDVSDFLAASIQEGDPVTLYPNSDDIGTLSGFSSEPAYTLVADPATGENVKEEQPGKCFLTVTVDCSGVYSRTGLTVGKSSFVVGGNYYLNVGPTRAQYRLMSVETVG